MNARSSSERSRASAKPSDSTPIVRPSTTSGSTASAPSSAAARNDGASDCSASVAACSASAPPNRHDFRSAISDPGAATSRSRPSCSSQSASATSVGGAADAQLLGHRGRDLRRVERGGQHRRDPRQALRAFAGGALPIARKQQLALVLAAVGRVEDGRADERGLPVRIPLEVGVEQHRQPAVVRADHLQRDLPDLPLHPQQRHVVGLVVDPPADREQVLEAPAADQVVAAIARPVQEGLVDLRDRPVRERREIPARGVLVEILVGLVVRGQPATLRVTGTT